MHWLFVSLKEVESFSLPIAGQRREGRSWQESQIQGLAGYKEVKKTALGSFLCNPFLGPQVFGPPKMPLVLRPWLSRSLILCLYYVLMRLCPTKCYLLHMLHEALKMRPWKIFHLSPLPFLFKHYPSWFKDFTKGCWSFIWWAKFISDSTLSRSRSTENR